MSSLSALFAALAFFPGAHVVERFGHRKRIVLASGGGLSRIALLGLAFVPFFADGDTAIWIVIVLASIRGFLGYFGLPAWTSLTADVVPLGMRGRFFASRNFGMSISALATAPIAGLLLDRFSGLDGWQIVWFVAFATGAASTWCFAQIPDPHPKADVVEREAASSRNSVFADVLADRNFMAYLLSTAIFNVALQASGPFFNVYLAENLHASGFMIGFLTGIMSITSLIGLLFFGRVMDDRGTKWLMVATGAVIPILPAAWLLVSEPWQVIPINLLAGLLWAGYQLAVLNMSIVIAPPEKRARYAATFHAVTFAAAFAGPLLGGWVIGAIGFRAVFVLSAVGRALGTLILARFVRSGSGEAGPTAGSGS